MRFQAIDQSIPMTDQDGANIDNFFATIAILQGGYSDVGLFYLAVKRAEAFVLVQGRVLFQTGAPTVPQQQFQTEHIRAGHYRLVDLGLDARSLLAKLMTGTLSTPHGDLVFPVNEPGI